MVSSRACRSADCRWASSWTPTATIPWGIACLFNVIEYYVSHTAAVAAALGLPGLSPASANVCRDKSVMRRRFHERINPSAAARFHEVTSEAELLRFADQLGYPVFLQPANAAASMWSTRNTDPEMLLAHYRAMISEVPRYYQQLGQSSTPLTVVLAEYLHGNDRSIDCLADHAGRVYPTPVVDVLKGKDVGLDDYHHFARIVPSRLSEVERSHLERLAVAGMQALDMTDCAAHVEFIGTKLGEIAARPGGNRLRILELAFGMDFIHAYYQILRGEKPDLRPARQAAAAIVTPFARSKGIFRAVRQLDRLKKLPTYLYHEVRAQPGQTVGLSKDGYRAPLYIELSSDHAEAVRDNVDQIASWADLYLVD